MASCHNFGAWKCNLGPWKSWKSAWILYFEFATNPDLNISCYHLTLMLISLTTFGILLIFLPLWQTRHSPTSLHSFAIYSYAELYDNLDSLVVCVSCSGKRLLSVDISLMSWRLLPIFCMLIVHWNNLILTDINGHWVNFITDFWYSLNNLKRFLKSFFILCIPGNVADWDS